jgi:hypothetical protein
MTRIVCIFLGMSLIAVPSLAQNPGLAERTANTVTAGADFPSPPATLRDAAWLAGAWAGTGLGGTTDESWSPPVGGAMMGMFRLVQKDKVVFYEFLTLVEHDGSLQLKLKHFNADLTGWEEKADMVRFRLLKVDGDAVYFEGLTFRRVGADRLQIFLALRNKGETVFREERFELTRR